MSRPALILPDVDDAVVSSACTQGVQVCPTSNNSNARQQQNDHFLSVLRERDGRCALCGIQTHFFRADPFNYNKSTKIPLTVEKEVLRGRCLLCHPITANLSGQEEEEEMGTNHSSSCLEDERTSASVLATPPSIEDDCDTDSSELVSLLHGMEHSPLDEHHITKSCEALWVYSWDDETSSIIGHLGGINRIIMAMINYPTNTHIQLCACGALENLACDLNNRSLIASSGGSILIIQTMMRRSTALSIQKSCLMALASLCQSPENRPGIIQAGGRRAILQSLQTFRHEASLLAYCYQALEALGDSS